MALIKCPECGRQVSNRAISCPNCGYPISNEDNILNCLKMQSNYNNIISKENRMKVFRMLAIVCVIFWGVLFMWQKTNASKITKARVTGFTKSIESITGIPGTQMSKSQEDLLVVNDIVDRVKAILIPLGIFFAILSIYYYIAFNNLKINNNTKG